MTPEISNLTAFSRIDPWQARCIDGVQCPDRQADRQALLAYSGRTGSRCWVSGCSHVIEQKRLSNKNNYLARQMSTCNDDRHGSSVAEIGEGCQGEQADDSLHPLAVTTLLGWSQ